LEAVATIAGVRVDVVTLAIHDGTGDFLKCQAFPVWIVFEKVLAEDADGGKHTTHNRYTDYRN
jgi:hypothetical protein